MIGHPDRIAELYIYAAIIILGAAIGMLVLAAQKSGDARERELEARRGAYKHARDLEDELDKLKRERNAPYKVPEQGAGDA